MLGKRRRLARPNCTLRYGERWNFRLQGAIACLRAFLPCRIAACPRDRSSGPAGSPDPQGGTTEERPSGSGAHRGPASDSAAPSQGRSGATPGIHPSRTLDARRTGPSGQERASEPRPRRCPPGDGLRWCEFDARSQDQSDGQQGHARTNRHPGGALGFPDPCAMPTCLSGVGPGTGDPDNLR